MRRQLILVLAILIVAVGVRVHLLQAILKVKRSPTETELVATALAAGKGWSNAFDADTGPTAHLAPLYPLLLSGVYRLCGNYETDSGRLVQGIFSIVLSLLIVLPLPVLAGKLGLSRTAGWIAAFAKACLVNDSEIWGSHENVLTTLALLGLLWCLADLRQHAWSGGRRLGLIGILVGLIALLSPNLLLVPLLFFLVELALRAEQRPRILRCGLILASFCLLFMTPWLFRNYRVMGGFVPLRSNFGLELSIGNRAGADGYTYAQGFDQLHPLNSAAERARLTHLGELPYMREKQQQGVQWIADNPRQFAWLITQRVWRFYLLKTEYWYQVDGPFQPLHIPVFTLFTGVVALEMLRLLRKNPQTARLLFCALLGAGLPYFVTHVEPRYRLPIIGLFLLLGCNLLAAMVARLREQLPRFGFSASRSTSSPA